MKKLFAAILLTILCLFPVLSCEAAELDVVIISDSEHRFAEAQPTLVSLREFLGHFKLRQRFVPLSDWEPGAASGADIVVFLGLHEAELSDEMLSEIARAPKIMWIEANIDRLADFLGWSDFRFEGRRGGWSTIKYRSLERPLADWIRCYVTEPGGGHEMFASVSDSFDEHPLSWRRDNVYYIGAMDFFEPFAMAAAVDFLHRVIPPESVIDQAASKKAMLRIEDVSPLVRADALRSVIEVVESHGIPYAVGVIPIGMTEKQSLTMKDNPELLSLLQAAQDNGASIIMHGYTHQNEFSPKTGEGWEFWNARDDRPMEDDEAFTRERIEKSFVELARNGLYPIAFEPPHYAMSKKGFEVLSDYFEVFSGMPQISDESYMISLTLPFVVRSEYLNGMLILPENMGYYDGVDYTVEGMLQSSGELLDVEDSFACFFYHGYLPSEKLHSIIEGVERQGYSFFDIRSLNVGAGSSQVRISVEDGNLSAWIDPDLIELWREEDSRPSPNAIVEKVAWVQAELLALVIIVFLFLIFRLRRNANRKYEVE